MTKKEFEEILEQLNIEIVEGEQEDFNKINIFPRILYFDYLWDFEVASSKIYQSKVTYQISYFSRIPRDPILLSLIEILLEKKCLTSSIKKEYITSDGGFWHSYFELEVDEDIFCTVKRI